MDLLLDTRNEDVDDVLANLGEHALVVAVELVVLRRDDDGIDALGNACIAILDGDNSGFILNVINGREGSNLYIKDIEKAQSKERLGAEEVQALKNAVSQ